MLFAESNIQVLPIFIFLCFTSLRLIPAFSAHTLVNASSLKQHGVYSILGFSSITENHKRMDQILTATPIYSRLVVPEFSPKNRGKQQ